MQKYDFFLSIREKKLSCQEKLVYLQFEMKYNEVNKT
jgi:hypothetical protein